MARISANESLKEASSIEQYLGEVPYPDLSKFYQDTRSRRTSILPPGAGADQEKVESPEDINNLKRLEDAVSKFGANLLEEIKDLRADRDHGVRCVERLVVAEEDIKVELR